MEIEAMKAFTDRHVLQACQCICHVMFESGAEWIGVYDSSNGHWLSMPHLIEVGYLTNLCVDGTNERIQHIHKFV